eukprot:gene10548-3429_t
MFHSNVRRIAGTAYTRALSTSPQTFASTSSTYQHFINGQYTPPSSGKYTPIFSPRTGLQFAQIAEASVDDVDAAIAAARACFDDHESAWRKTAVEERAAMLNVMADSLEARKGEFATLETLDCGKPIAESEADIDFCVDILHVRLKASVTEKYKNDLSSTDRCGLLAGVQGLFFLLLVFVASRKD